MANGKWQMDSRERLRPKSATCRVPFSIGDVIALLILAPTARAQTDTRMLRNPWPTEKTWGETNDHIIYQVNDADIRNDPNDAQVFWWDSTGRFRLSTTQE